MYLCGSENLQEQVMKAFCFKNSSDLSAIWVNYSNHLKKFANFKSCYQSLEPLFLRVGCTTNFQTKKPINFRPR